MPDDSTLLNIRIAPSQKRDWEEYASAEGYGTLTNLIKHSVESTISDEWVLQSETDIEVDSDDLDIDLSGIESRLSVIEDQLDTIQSPPADEADERELERHELIELANRAHKRLPKVPTPEYLDVLVEYPNIVDEDEKPMLTGTAADIADVLGEPVYHVRQSLIWLEREQHAGVDSRIDDGIRRWYELDPSMDIDDIDEELDSLDAADLSPEEVFTAGDEL